MKKYILMPLLAVFALTAAAQDFDTDPTLELENAEKQVKFTVGARMMADAALYHSDFTPMHRNFAGRSLKIY
jgi:phosphate-selective porin OprO/OprP